MLTWQSPECLDFASNCTYICASLRISLLYDSIAEIRAVVDMGLKHMSAVTRVDLENAGLILSSSEPFLASLRFACHCTNVLKVIISPAIFRLDAFTILRCSLLVRLLALNRSQTCLCIRACTTQVRRSTANKVAYLVMRLVLLPDHLRYKHRPGGM